MSATTPTRRRALAVIAGASIATPVVTAAAAPDDPFLVVWRQRRAACREHDALNDRWEKLSETLPPYAMAKRAYLRIASPDDDASIRLRSAPTALEADAENYPEGAERVRTFLADELARRQRELAEVRQQHGLDDLDRALQAVSDRMEALGDLAQDTAPTTPLGLAVKLRSMAARFEPGGPLMAAMNGMADAAAILAAVAMVDAECPPIEDDE